MRESRRPRAKSRPERPRPGPLLAPRSPESVVRDLIQQTTGVTPEPLEAPRRLVPIEGPVRILFMDLDGTLTNGVITYDTTGDQRHFGIRDGLSLQWAMQHGIRPVVISGRSSKAAELRMEDLSLEFYFGIQDKVAVAEQVRQRENVEWRQCVMVGDDLPDIALMKRVGWPIAVSDAVPQVKQVAHTITFARAGYGAIREVVETILKHNGVWAQVLARYEAT
jgi:3-deoxy-D-manno-octulosonate 8-phosphate phosphatase (KDO 8-P phosphatase)